jgi:tetratricopeptide (TPR) repeat protein
MMAPFILHALVLSTVFVVQPDPAVVSVDALRHPMTAKVRKLLLGATDRINSGDYATAIGQLQDMLAKYPESAPFVHDLLGVAYVKTDRYQDAISSFEQAVTLLPHDAMTHYSFGLALVCAGDYERATQEVQRAVELDPKNARMRERLNELLAKSRSGN